MNASVSHEPVAPSGAGRAPLPARELLGNGARVYRHVWPGLLLLAAIITVPVALVAFMVAREAIPMGAWVEHGTILTASDASLSRVDLVMRIAVVMTVFGNLLSVAALHVALADAYATGSCDWRASLRAGIRRGPTVLAIAALTTAASTVPGALVEMFGVSDASVLSTVTDLALLAVILMSMTIGMFAIPTAVREGLGPIASLRRAGDVLTSGWARVTVAFLMCGAIGGIVTAVLNASLGQAIRGGTGSVDMVFLGVLIPFTLGLVLTAPLNAGVATAAYFDQRRLHGEDPAGDAVITEPSAPPATDAAHATDEASPVAASDTAAVPAPPPVAAGTTAAESPNRTTSDVPPRAGDTADTGVPGAAVAPPVAAPTAEDDDASASPPQDPASGTTTGTTSGIAASPPASGPAATVHEPRATMAGPPALPEWSDDEDAVPIASSPALGDDPVVPGPATPAPVTAHALPDVIEPGPPGPIPPADADVAEATPPVPAVRPKTSAPAIHPTAPGPAGTSPSPVTAASPGPERRTDTDPVPRRAPAASAPETVTGHPAPATPTRSAAGRPGPDRSALQPVPGVRTGPPADPAASPQPAPVAEDDDIPRIAVIPVARSTSGTPPVAPIRTPTSAPPDAAPIPTPPPASPGLPDWDDWGADPASAAAAPPSAPSRPARPKPAPGRAAASPGGRPPAPPSRPAGPAPASRPAGRPPDGTGAPPPRPANRPPPAAQRMKERPPPPADPEPAGR